MLQNPKKWSQGCWILVREKKGEVGDHSKEVGLFSDSPSVANATHPMENTMGYKCGNIVFKAVGNVGFIN